MKYDFIQNGRLVLGVNYLASHAGLDMWKNWRADVVEEDFRRFAEYGVRLVRVPPLWSDFQPIEALYKGKRHAIAEYRIHGEPLPDTEAGRSGIDPVMIDHMAELLDLAEKHGLNIVVNMVTGQMSFGLFIPPALEGMDPITDPRAMKWAVRFVTYLVKRFRNAKAIAGWSLGNEIQHMSDEANADQAYVFSALIANTIRAHDPDHPVISGMDYMDPEGVWKPQDHGELCDIMTAHPYPSLCHYGPPFNTIQPIFHHIASEILHEDLGEKPCYIEEYAVNGYFNCSQHTEMLFHRNVLLNAFAYNCRAMTLWVSGDYGELRTPPYFWNTIGSQYGLFDKDGNPKEFTHLYKEFFDLDQRIGQIPPREVDGVCILPAGWGEGNYIRRSIGTFILAKQAGLDIEFRYATQSFPDAPLYILPSIEGGSVMTRDKWDFLLDRVRKGAVLYFSTGLTMFRDVPDITGLTIQCRERYEKENVMILDSEKVPVYAPFVYEIEKEDCEVLARDENGRAVFVRKEFGEGCVYFLNMPLEKYVSEKYDAFHPEDAPNFWKVYKKLTKSLHTRKVVQSSCRYVTWTEHDLSANEKMIIAVNNSPVPREKCLSLASGWKVTEVLYGNAEHFDENDGVIMKIKYEG